MRLRNLLPLLLLGAVTVSHAGPTAADMRALFGIRIALACVAQEPELRKLPFVRAVLEVHPDFKGWDAFAKLPLTRCLAARRWIAEPLCRDAVAAFETSLSSDRGKGERAFDAVLDRNAGALALADDVLYIQDDAVEAKQAFTCPATPAPRSHLHTPLPAASAAAP